MKLLTACSLSAFGTLLVGCSTLEPTGGVVPAPGMGVAFDINDVGRVGLGGQIGPEISQIEGMLLQKDSTEYLVAVETVHFLRGGDQVWKREHVRIKPSFVSAVYEKHFSKTRTVLASAASVSVLAALFGRSILGGGTTQPDAFKSDSANSVRIPRP